MKPQITNAITRLKKDMNAFCFFDAQKFNLSIGVLPFLKYIGDYEIASPSHMAKDLLMDPAHVARSIDKLVKLEFVREEHIKYQDRRKKSYVLTLNGENAYNAIIQAEMRWEDSILSELDKNDKEYFISLLKKIENTKTM